MPSVTFQRVLGWQSPGDPKSPREAEFKRNRLVKVDSVPGVDTIWVHRAVRTQFNALALILQANGAKLPKRVDDWGYANRPIRGATSSSYHRFGLAVDLDATENVLGSGSTTFPPVLIHRVLKRSLLNLRWGYDYHGRKDPMHFEFTGSRARARFVSGRLRRNTKRARTLAGYAKMDVDEFVRRIS